MNSKIILATMLCCTAFVLPQVDRYQAIGYVYGTPSNLSRRLPCSIWVTIDSQIILIDTAVYHILRKYTPEAQPEGSFAFTCVGPLHHKCEISFHRNTTVRYDYSLVVEWKDSIKLWEVNKR